MTVGDLIRLLREIPENKDVAIATPDSTTPDDPGMDDLWSIVPQKPEIGTHGVILIAKRHAVQKK